MSKLSSHLGRPASAGWKNTSWRKELHGNCSNMLKIGERLMRAGSEGSLVQKPFYSQDQSPLVGLHGSSGQTQQSSWQDKPNLQHTGCNSSKDPENLPSKLSSSCNSTAEDSRSVEHLLPKKQLINRSMLHNPELSCQHQAPHSPSTLPLSSAFSRERMQHSDSGRKKDVLIGHLGQKYPHHAAIIMGQECMMEQVQSPKFVESLFCSGVVVEKQDHTVSETMCDGGVLPPSVPFTRGCKARASLPVGRTRCQTRERPLGMLYLQYGEETRQVRIPPEISSQDSVRALFVTAFPHQLTMKMLQSPNMAIYIKDTCRNIYYDLDDLRNITPGCSLKAYHKDPVCVFNRHARPANVEGRISKEMLYGPVHTRSPLHSLQGSMSPPMVRSMPSSPSKMAYSGKKAGLEGVNLGSITLPRQHLSARGRSKDVYTSSSTILERRDVKPDEDTGSSKHVLLVLPGDGGPLHPESYSSSLLDAGRHYISAPPSLAPKIMVDSGIPGIPGGLQQYRATIKPLMGHGESMEHQTSSNHKQRNRKHGDSHPPSQGSKTPPTSPHRGREVRMVGRQVVGGVGMGSSERMSPIHCSFQRDGNGAIVEMGSRSRGSSSSMSSVFVDSPLGQQKAVYLSPVTASDTHSERMKAMEEQIASLAGLVHNALAMGSDVPGLYETYRENIVHKVHDNRLAVSSKTQDPASRGLLALQAPPTGSCLQQSLMLAKRNVCELRLQLSQLRSLQLSNLEGVSLMLRMMKQEVVQLMCDRLSQCEEAAYRQRSEMEEDRIQYVTAEQEVLTQLSELETYVGHLQSSTCSRGPVSVTLREVEAGALSLRNVGEALAILKAMFPELQLKMRSVLRLEVEVVRFLKEEPQKIDCMLKRVRVLNEGLSCLHRCVSTAPNRAALVEPLKVLEVDQESPKIQSPHSSPKPLPQISIRCQAEGSSEDPAPSIMKVVQPPHCHFLIPAHGQHSPVVSKTTETPNNNQSLDQDQSGPGQPPSSDSSQTLQSTYPVQEVHVDLRGSSPGLDEAPMSPRSEQITHQDQALKAAVGHPLPICSHTVSSSQTKMDKPPRSSVDRDRKQNMDRDSSSPPFPPPAPHRAQAVGSGDMIQKQPAGSQYDGNKPAAAEVQHKVQVCDHPATIRPPPTSVSAHSKEEDHKQTKEQKTAAEQLWTENDAWLLCFVLKPPPASLSTPQSSDIISSSSSASSPSASSSSSSSSKKCNFRSPPPSSSQCSRQQSSLCPLSSSSSSVPPEDHPPIPPTPPSSPHVHKYSIASLKLSNLLPSFSCVMSNFGPAHQKTLQH